MMQRGSGHCKGSKVNETVSADSYATRGGSDFLVDGGSCPISVEAVEIGVLQGTDQGAVTTHGMPGDGPPLRHEWQFALQQCR